MTCQIENTPTPRRPAVLKQCLLITVCALALLVGDRRTSGFRSIGPNVHLLIIQDAIKSEFQDKETFAAINRKMFQTDLLGGVALLEK